MTRAIQTLALISLANAFVACSSNDDEMLLQNESGCITFETPTVANSWSRADVAKLPADITKFRVWGTTENPYKVVLDWNVVNKGANDWALDVNKSWEAGKTYYFNAIYPASDLVANMVISNPDQGHAGTVYFDNLEAQGKVDLLYANSGPITCSNSASQKPVKLEFKHIMSQFTFSFDNELGEGYDIEVTGLALYLDWASGKINMEAAQPRWERIERVEHWMRPIDCSAKAANSQTLTSEPRYLMDQTGKIPVAFAIWVSKDGKSLGSFPHLMYLPSVKFQPGMSYDFHATINLDNYKRSVEGGVNEVGEGEKFEFEVSSSPVWNPATTSTLSR